MFLTRIIRVNLWLELGFFFTASEVGGVSQLPCELSLY